MKAQIFNSEKLERLTNKQIIHFFQNIEDNQILIKDVIINDDPENLSMTSYMIGYYNIKSDILHIFQCKHALDWSCSNTYNK